MADDHPPPPHALVAPLVHLAAAALTLWLALLARLMPARGEALADRLPHRRRDVFTRPLPGVTRVLVAAALLDTRRGERHLEAADASRAQGPAAAAARVELRALQLAQAAEDGDWGRAATLDLPFQPAQAPPPGHPVWRFVASARAMQAAGQADDPRRMRFRTRQAAERLGDAPAGDALEPTRAIWHGIIAEQLAAAERALRGRLPRVYVTDGPLDRTDPDAVQVFRPRTELMSTLVADLAAPGPVALEGPARSGRTSLLRMLPDHLPDSTVIVVGGPLAAGSGRADAPLAWIADAAYHVRPVIAPLPFVASQTDALTWLDAFDARLERPVVLAVDDADHLEPSALRALAHAAGQWTHLRLLLTGVDVSVEHARRHALGPLARAEAEALLTRPVEDFPAGVYDPAAVEAVLAATGGRPWAINRVGDAVVTALSARGARVATADDIAWAVAQVGSPPS